jgi:hypothetical protein
MYSSFLYIDKNRLRFTPSLQTNAYRLLIFHGPTALVGQGILYEFPRSHSDTPHSVGLLLKSDRPVAETST